MPNHRFTQGFQTDMKPEPQTKGFFQSLTRSPSRLFPGFPEMRMMLTFKFTFTRDCRNEAAPPFLLVWTWLRLTPDEANAPRRLPCQSSTCPQGCVRGGSEPTVWPHLPFLDSLPLALPLQLPLGLVPTLLPLILPSSTAA